MAHTTFTFQYGEIKSNFISLSSNGDACIYIPVWRD